MAEREGFETPKGGFKSNQLSNTLERISLTKEMMVHILGNIKLGNTGSTFLNQYLLCTQMYMNQIRRKR